MHCKVCYYYSSGGKNSNLERKFHYFTIGKGSCAKQYGIKCDFKCDYLAASIAIYKGRNEWIKITEKKNKEKDVQLIDWFTELQKPFYSNDIKLSVSPSCLKKPQTLHFQIASDQSFSFYSDIRTANLLKILFDSTLTVSKWSHVALYLNVYIWKQQQLKLYYILWRKHI